MPENEIETASLINKLGKIDKLEERQVQHAKEIKEIKDAIHSNELDGRIIKVEKRQELVFDKLKDVDNDIRKIEEKCDKQRSGCMAAVAPLPLVVGLKEDIQRMVVRFETALDTTQTNFRVIMREANDTNSKWTRWAFVLSMLSCIVSSISVLVCANVLLHLPK
jgi:chromosome segregation ATPase